MQKYSAINLRIEGIDKPALDSDIFIAQKEIVRPARTDSQTDAVLPVGSFSSVEMFRAAERKYTFMVKRSTGDKPGEFGLRAVGADGDMRLLSKDFQHRKH